MPGAGEDRRLPPRDGKTKAVTVGTSATAAVTVDCAEVDGPQAGPAAGANAAAVTAAGAGPGYYTFEATGGKICICFGPLVGMGAPAMSGAAKNSETIPEDGCKDIWLESEDIYYRAIASAASCTLSYRRSSTAGAVS